MKVIGGKSYDISDEKLDEMERVRDLLYVYLNGILPEEAESMSNDFFEVLLEELSLGVETCYECGRTFDKDELLYAVYGALYCDAYCANSDEGELVHASEIGV